MPLSTTTYQRQHHAGEDQQTDGEVSDQQQHHYKHAEQRKAHVPVQLVLYHLVRLPAGVRLG